MVTIAVVVGSTRPGRRSKQVADWVFARATSKGGADFEILDLADYNLPLLDEPMPPSLGNYQHHQGLGSDNLAVRRFCLCDG